MTPLPKRKYNLREHFVFENNSQERVENRKSPMCSPLHIGLSHYGRNNFSAYDQTYKLIKTFQ